MKGIILAGGHGTRLFPITIPTSKQLLPIFDKPLIYYPLSLLMLIGIKEILIIVNKKDLDTFVKLLGNGQQFGINIKFDVQIKPSGIPESFIIGKNFINNNSCVLILGDNIFYGQGLIKLLRVAKNDFTNGAKIFTYPVKNPKDFGVAELKKNKIMRLVEKPKNTNSNQAITGLYFFDKNVSNFSKKLKPSKRNETEIIDVLNYYRKIKKLKLTKLGRGCTWLDTGTIRNNLTCSNFIQITEDRQNYKIGCPEEIAFKNNWINKKQLIKSIQSLGKNDYAEYLKSLIK